MKIAIDAIKVGPGRRRAAAEKVRELAKSIASLGLQTPITVRPAKQEGRYVLVAGRHRLEACRSLGWQEIDIRVMTDLLDAQMWEIAENLHRAELTKLERNLLIGGWVKLHGKKLKRDQGSKVFQVGTVSAGGRGLTGGLRAAARELNIAPVTAHRAVTIAEKLVPAAQKEAVRLGLDDNQQALSHAATAVGAEAQVADLQRYAERKREREATRERIAAVLEGRAPPADAKDAFERWHYQLDPVWQRKVVEWLREVDPIALADELERWMELLAQDAASLH